MVPAFDTGKSEVRWTSATRFSNVTVLRPPHWDADFHMQWTQRAHRGREEWVKRTRRWKERARGGGGLWFDIQGSPLMQPWGKSQRAESLAPRALPWERENASMGRLCNLQEIWTARFSLEQMPRGRWIIQCAAMCHSENQDEEKWF